MRLNNEISSHGYFWLPEQPDNKISGTLQIIDSGKIELEILGLFAGVKTVFENAVNIPRILGQVEELGLITVENCFYTQRKLTFGDNLKRLKLFAHCVYSGVHYEADETPSFDEFSFQVEGLTQWLGRSGLSQRHSDDFKSISIQYSKPDSLSFEIDDNCELRIDLGHSLRNNNGTLELKESSWCTFKTINTLPLPYFLSLANKITNFLCFAIDKTVCIKNVSAKSSNLTYEFEGKSTKQKVGLFYQAITFVDKPSKIYPHEMLFRLADIEDNFEAVFKSWCSAYEDISPSFGLYFAYRQKAHRYLSDSFLALVQGLETMHRRMYGASGFPQNEFEEMVSKLIESCPKDKQSWLEGKLKFANEMGLRSRLKKLIEPIKEHLGNKNERKSILNKILVTRNYLTHYNKEFSDKSAKGDELYNLVILLEGIFQIHFLNLVGFDSGEIKNIYEKNYKLRQKLRIG